ncbi:hypothetical protein Tco_1176970 [Tanacetum coccineum]
MAALESCPKHNMIAYLEKTDGNAEFHEIMDFLTRSSIYYALTVSPVVSTTFVEQFWMSAKSKTINNVRYITATVASKPMTISEASIRKDEGEASEIPSESQPIPSHTHPSEDQPEPQPDLSPRPSPSIPILDSNLEGSGGNHIGKSSSDRSLLGNEDGLTLQSIYDLCVSLCKQVTLQAKQIKDLKAQIKKLKQKARPMITHHKAWMKSGRKTAKSKPTAHKDQAFDDLDDFDAMDYMETEDAHNEKGVSTEDQVSTVKPDEGTDKPKVSTNKIDEAKKPNDDIFKHVGGKKHSDLKTKNFEEIQVLYEKVKRSDENFIAIGSAEDERLIKDVNKKATGTKKDNSFKKESKEEETPYDDKEGDLSDTDNPDDEDKFWNSQQDWNVVSWKLHSSSGVHTLMTEAGLVIHMLVEKKLSIHLVVYNEELAIPEQTATEGKLKENQGCRVDTDQVHQNGDLKNRSVWIHPPGLQDVYTKET